MSLKEVHLFSREVAEKRGNEAEELLALIANILDLYLAKNTHMQVR